MNEAGIIQKIRRAISSESKTVFIRPDLELRDQITKTIEVGFDSIGDCLDAVNDFQEIRKSFLDSINDLYTHVDKSGEIDVNNEYFLAYLRSHFSIYKKLIFSKDNRNLNNDDFRRSVLLRNLMSFCIVKNLEKENTSDLQVVDPFFL